MHDRLLSACHSLIELLACVRAYSFTQERNFIRKVVEPLNRVTQSFAQVRRPRAPRMV